MRKSLYLIQVYPEQLLIRIAKKTFATLGCSDNEFFEEMGYFFVEFVAQVDIVLATRAMDSLLLISNCELMVD